LQLVAAEAAVVGELEQRDHGVAARRENEDEGTGGRGVAVGLGEVEGRRLDVLWAEAGAHKLLDDGHDFVGAEDADDAEAAEAVESVVPFGGKGLLVGLCGVVDRLPRVLLRQELFAQVLEGG